MSAIGAPELEQAKRFIADVHARRDVVSRLEIMAAMPMASQWMLVRQELEDAAIEIRRLRRRVEELEGDGA